MKEQYIPVHPAPPSQVMPHQGALFNHQFCVTLMAIMLQKQGLTEFTFTQEDFDKAAGLMLLEGYSKDGFSIGLGYNTKVTKS